MVWWRWWYDKEVEEAPPEWPLRFPVEYAINVIWNAASYSSNGEEISLVINRYEKLFTEDQIASKKQTNIFDFLKPVRL